MKPGSIRVIENEKKNKGNNSNYAFNILHLYKFNWLKIIKQTYTEIRLNDFRVIAFCRCYTKEL